MKFSKPKISEKLLTPTSFIHQRIESSESNDSLIFRKNLSFLLYHKMKKTQMPDTNLVFIHRLNRKLFLKKRPALFLESKINKNSTRQVSKNPVFSYEPSNQENSSNLTMNKIEASNIRSESLKKRDISTGNSKGTQFFLPVIYSKDQESSGKLHSNRRHNCYKRGRNLMSRGIQVDSEEF